jgi:glycosyltransferase involved in cell wall biosynthesis
MNPLVTCLCLTMNRRQWLPHAINSFLLQSYEPRELLIVGDGDDVSDLIPADTRIRLICCGTRLEIGPKRNYGIERCAGLIIAHWDDDDYSSPYRLEDQVGRLLASGKAITAYRTMKFTDGRDWWLYSGLPGVVVGTSLCYRRDWWAQYPFESVHVGEDNRFVDHAISQKQLVISDGADMMHATIHPDNSSNRDRSTVEWTKLT